MKEQLLYKPEYNQEKSKEFLNDAINYMRRFQDLPEKEINFDRIPSGIIDSFVYGIIIDLPKRNKKIIELRYGLLDGHSYTLKELGKIFRLSRSRIGQIEQQGFFGIIKTFKKKSITDLLKCST